MTAYAVLEPTGSGLAGFGQWRYRTAVDAFPGAGRLQFDDLTIDNATELYINVTNDGGTDMSAFLALVEPGDLIYIQVSTDSTQFVVCEVGTSSNAAGVYTFPLTAVEGQGSAPSNNTLVSVVSTVGGGIPGDHGALSGLTDDDHSQYPLLVGRAGGQGLFGGTASGEVLALYGSNNAQLGSVTLGGFVNLDWDWTVSGNNGGIIWDNVIPATGGSVVGLIRNSAQLTVNNALFISATVYDLSVTEHVVNPGFAVATLFLAQPTYKTSTAAVNPIQAFIYAAQPQFQNDGAGAGRTVPTFIGLTANATLATTTSGDALTMTNFTGVQMQPIFSTVAGTSISFGTITGLRCLNPVKGIFAPGAGTEAMVAYYGVHVFPITFGGNVTKVALRSDITFATNSRFLWNSSNAVSDFGGGHIYFNDDTYIGMGTGVLAADTLIGWVGAGAYLRHYFASTADSLRWSSPAADRFLFDNDGGSTTGEYNFNCSRFSFGAQTGNNGNQVGNFVTPARTIGLAGDWSDFLLTQGASLTVNGLAMGRVSAWVINGISYASSSGSVVNADTLTVGGFVTSSPGVTITNRQSLFVIGGRSHFNSSMQYEPINPSTLAAGNVNNWAGLLTGSANNNMRHWARVTPDGGGTSVITGIDTTAMQDGDCFKITNIGAANLTLGHQDANSLAGNRFISPTGANYVLGADESAEIIYDATTTRIRILYGSGA